MRTKNKQNTATRKEKIEWLLKYYKLWEGVSSGGDNKIIDTIQAMKEDGLYAKSNRPSSL